MSKTLSRDDAWTLLTQYNKEHDHQKHAPMRPLKSVQDLSVKSVKKYIKTLTSQRVVPAKRSSAARPCSNGKDEPIEQMISAMRSDEAMFEESRHE